MLATVYGVHACRYYLNHHPSFDIFSDHKPNQFLFNGDRDVDNARMGHLIEKLNSYNMHLCYLPGWGNLIVDILSHNPLDTTDAEDIPMVVKAKLAMARVVKIGDKRVYSESMWTMGERAEEYVQLMEALHADTPMTENNIESPDRLYGKVYTDLSILNIEENSTLVMFGNKRAGHISSYHEAHLGARMLTKTMKQSYWWPCMKNKIMITTRECDSCTTFMKKTNLLAKQLLQWTSKN